MHVSRARQQRVPLLHIAPRLASVSFCLALALIALALFRAPPSRADAFEGLQSYEQGRKDEAIRLLRRAAWQDNSIFAQFKLAEIYSAKSESDKGYKDLVEAAVWYYLALLNVDVGQDLYFDQVRDRLNDQYYNEARQRLPGIYANLLQDERIDLRNRITYIEACRGPEGLLLLGQLHDRRFERTTPYLPPTASGPNVPPTNNNPDFWASSGGGYWPSYGSGGGYGPSFSPFGGSLYGDQPFEKSELEARLFYTLAKEQGHPLARHYLEGLSDYSSYGFGTNDPKQAELLARAKAERWLSPFEFYAAETRYRGELPSGLVLSDECPINHAREKALFLAKRLIPPQVAFEFLDFLGFARGYSFRDMTRGVSKFQDFMGDPQTGELTPIELVRLIQIAAVRGHKKAQRCLGIMYVKGVGVMRDLVRAERWLVAAAEQGDGEAMYALSELYSLGGRGIEKAEDKANRYRQGSAVQGFQPVRSELLRLLENPPPPDDQPGPGPRPRHHYRHAADEPESDE